MKRIVAFLLVCVLTLSAFSAFAAVPEGAKPAGTNANGSVTEYIRETYNTQTGETTYEHFDVMGKATYTRTEKLDGKGGTSWKMLNAEGEVLFYGTETENNTEGIRTSIVFSPHGVPQYFEYKTRQGTLTLDEYKELTSADVNLATGHYTYENGKWYVDGLLSATADTDMAPLVRKAQKAYPPVRWTDYFTWYMDNTVGVAGISLREMDPKLTDKWYNVLPVDLSQDGAQTFPLIAANLYYMGDVTVTVAGDEVTTTYTVPVASDLRIYPGDECLAWFTSLNEITHEYLEYPAPKHQFGRAVSKTKDLKGRNIALLFVCNRVSYTIPLNRYYAMPARFSRRNPQFISFHMGLKRLVKQMEVVQTR